MVRMTENGYCYNCDFDIVSNREDLFDAFDEGSELICPSCEFKDNCNSIANKISYKEVKK